MDVSTKIPGEKIKIVNELQVGLRKRNIKKTQKFLITKALEYSLEDHRQDFIKNKLVMDGFKKDIEEKKLWERFLNNKIRMKGDFIKEHDTVL